jgi:hypothetical protein
MSFSPSSLSCPDCGYAVVSGLDGMCGCSNIDCDSGVLALPQTMRYPELLCCGMVEDVFSEAIPVAFRLEFLKSMIALTNAMHTGHPSDVSTPDPKP